jgi:hypothetical protein
VFGGGRCFAASLEADQHDAEGPFGGKTGAAFAQQGDQFVVDDLDDLLTGRDGSGHFLANAFLPDPIDEFPGHTEMDVGGKQGGPHFLERVGDIFVGQFTDSADVPYGLAEPFGQCLEHKR